MDSDISGVVAPFPFSSQGVPSHLSQASTGTLLSLQLQVRSRRMLVYSFVVQSGCEYLSRERDPVVFATRSLPHEIFVTDRSSLHVTVWLFPFDSTLKMQAKKREGGHLQVISASDPVVGAGVLAGQFSCLDGHLVHVDPPTTFFFNDEICFTPFTGCKRTVVKLQKMAQ